MGKNKTNEELQKLWLDIVIRALPSEEVIFYSGTDWGTEEGAGNFYTD